MASTVATKKVGPPVPPRPSAVSVAHALVSNKSRSASPTPSKLSRNVVYKSPSLENTSKPALTPKPSPLERLSPEKKPVPNPKTAVKVAPPVPKPRTKSPARVAPPTLTPAAQIDIEDPQTIAFTNKFFNELAERNRGKGGLPSRPEPEGKEREVKEETAPRGTMNDKMFTEMLISELSALHPGEKGGKVEVRVTNEERSSNEVSPHGTKSRIRTSDWIEVGDNGTEVLMTSCHISLEDSGLEDEEKLDDASSGVGDSWDSVRDTEERIKMSLPGLPPLPKSLSGFEVAQAQTHTLATLEQQRAGLTHNRQPATLDTQLAILRREMYGLRQLDLSLLSQLWTLNESIQEFRTILQEQEALSPPSPTPSNSQSDSELPSSEEDEISSERDRHMLPLRHHHFPMQSQVPPTSQAGTPTHHPSGMGQHPKNAAANRMRIAPPPPPSRPV